MYGETMIRFVAWVNVNFFQFTDVNKGFTSRKTSTPNPKP